MAKTRIDLYVWRQNAASVLAVQGEPIDLTNAVARLYIAKPDHIVVI